MCKEHDQANLLGGEMLLFTNYKHQNSGPGILKGKENLKKNEKGSGSFGIFCSLYVYEGCSFLYNNAEQNESLKTQGLDRIWITL